VIKPGLFTTENTENTEKKAEKEIGLKKTPFA